MSARTASVGTTFAFLFALAFITLITTTPAQAQTYTESTYYSFPSPPAEGMWPWGGLIIDSSGTLYGTTYAGGSAICSGGCGTVFKLDSAGTETVLHTFTGTDGENPQQLLTMDSSGNLYSTIFGTGPSADGIVFKIDSAGTFSIVHRFNGGDGSQPYGPVTFDTLGNLYGTTQNGGASGDGVVFKIAADGTFSDLYEFKGGTDGSGPQSNLVLDNAGNIYGTTGAGGLFGGGMVFRVTPSGVKSVLYSFCKVSGCADGSNPMSLLRSANGTLYGVTFAGGTTNQGTVFQVTGAGAETVLYSFCPAGVSSHCRDGEEPMAITLSPNGKIFGTTYSGGAGNSTIDPGVVFEVPSPGSEIVLYRFPAYPPTWPDGGNPTGGVVMDSAGNLYGNTYSGGPNGEGLLFKLTKN